MACHTSRTVGRAIVVSPANLSLGGGQKYRRPPELRCIIARAPHRAPLLRDTSIFLPSAPRSPFCKESLPLVERRWWAVRPVVGSGSPSAEVQRVQRHESYSWGHGDSQAALILPRGG